MMMINDDGREEEDPEYIDLFSVTVQLYLEYHQ